MPQEKNILVNRGIPLRRSPSLNLGPGGSIPNGSGFGGMSGTAYSDLGPDTIDYANEWLIESNTDTEKIYRENIKNLKHITDAELSQTRETARKMLPLGVDANNIEARTLTLHLSKARADHQEQVTIANRYYGHDPLTHKGRDPFYKGFDAPDRISQGEYYKAVGKWNISYAAAYEAKFLAEQIKLLEARLVIQNKVVAEASARTAAAAQAKAQADRQRTAAIKARKAAKAEAKRNAKRRRIAAKAAQRQAEIPEARKPVLAATTRPVLASAAIAPALSVIGGSFAADQVIALAITNALRAAAAAVIDTLITLAGPAAAGITALVYTSELGNGDLYVLSVPLSELAPDNTDDLHAIATSRGETHLPVALGSRTIANKTEFIVAATPADSTLAKVPVRLATFDPQENIYKSHSQDAESIGITWTPVVTTDNVSTSLPASIPDVIHYSGAILEIKAGRLDTHPELDRYSFGGFVTVFPVESGIAPLYTVFSNPYEGATTKGEHSGRDFNPDKAGGPIIDLDWRTATVTREGIDTIKLHIARLSPSDANGVMIKRLENILSGDIDVTDTDLRYYTHEIRELERFRNLGLRDDFVPTDDSSYWNNAHTATLEDYKIQDRASLLYTTDALAKADLQDERDYKKMLKEMGQ
ncbi:S-type pyocin domain-containing protein [Pseudomonas corrugata]|uniref:S-type pyocin domain-containing protein n=1 Tax=Pseudomonas corrugata TaxID=47879 RepID=A0A8B6UTK7_9PSED|nr:S-type pyocin domain-containing protein [Pseudomonas corrugata]MDU9024139.1 S-type pyocin domain-containing protein [Pseudomonas corrugata]MDU9025404.1 S-type pyocin domain-containing protein [Pseudomonas corrugata]QTH15234.1 S-type pyocin domain-containing protein [Pseudomonas corrugata]